MTILEYIKTILLALAFLGAFLGMTPYLIIILGTLTIVPYYFLCKGIFKRINNQENKTVKISGYLAIIIPLIIVVLTTYFTRINILKDEVLMQLLIVPNLALVECICLYLCFYDLRNNRTIISDIKNGITLIKTHKKQIIIVSILIISLLVGNYISKNYYSIVSDDFPVQGEYCRKYHPIKNSLIFGKNNSIIESSLDDEEYESSEYNYIYNKRAKTIKYYAENKRI